MNITEAIRRTEEATRDGAFVGRAWREGVGPCVITLRGGRVIDITSRAIATVRDLCEAEHPASLARSATAGVTGRRTSGDLHQRSGVGSGDLPPVRRAVRPSSRSGAPTG